METINTILVVRLGLEFRTPNPVSCNILHSVAFRNIPKKVILSFTDS